MCATRMSLDRRGADYEIDVDSDVEVVEIVKRPGHSLGFYIREGNGLDRKDGIFISRTTGDASRSGNNNSVQVGDEIIAVNGVEVRRMSLDDVVVLLSVPQKLALHVRRVGGRRQAATASHRTIGGRQRKETESYAGSPGSAGGSGRQRLSDESADSDPPPAAANRAHRSRLGDAANRNGLQREAVANRHGLQQREARYRRQHSSSDVLVDDNDSGLSSENSVNSREYQQRAVQQNVSYSLQRTAPYAASANPRGGFDPSAAALDQRVRFDDARARYVHSAVRSSSRGPHSDTDAYDNEPDDERTYRTGEERDAFEGSRSVRKGRLARSLTAKEYNSDSELARDANESFVSMNSHEQQTGGRRWRSSNSVTITDGCPFCERPLARDSYVTRRNATASDLRNDPNSSCLCPHCNSQLDAPVCRHAADSGYERNAVPIDDAQVAQMQLANLLASRKHDASANSHMTPMQSRLLLLERAAQRHPLASQQASAALLAAHSPPTMLNHPGPFALQQSASAMASPSHSNTLLHNGPARLSRWQQLLQMQSTQASAAAAPIHSVAGAYAALRRRQLLKQSSLDSLPFGEAANLDAVLLNQNELPLRSALSSSGVPVPASSLSHVDADADSGNSSQAAFARLQHQLQSLCVGGSNAAQQLLNRLAPKQLRSNSGSPQLSNNSRLPNALQCLNKRADFNVEEFQPRASDRISRWGAGRPASDGLDGLLQVRVFGGRGLQATSGPSGPLNGVASNSLIKDLYCVLELDSSRRARTAIKTGIDEFEWDDLFELELDATRVLTVLVFNWDAAVAQLQHTLFYYANVSLLHFVQETQLTCMSNTYASASASAHSTAHKLALRLEPKGVLYVELSYRPLRSALSRRPLSRPFATGAAPLTFGIPLDVLVAREQQQQQQAAANAGQTLAESSHVPVIVRRLVDEIEARGVDVLGLYQQACSGRAKQRLRELLDRIDPAAVDLSTDAVADVHVLATTLKDFLRELPEPLFTNALYRMLVDSVGTQLRTGAASQNTATAGFAHLHNSKLLLSVLDCLPIANQCTVVYLLDHLKRVAKRCEVNKMTRASLAARFGPILLSPSTVESFTNEQLANEVHKQVDCLKWLLDGWPDLTNDRGYSLISSFSATAASTMSLTASAQNAVDVSVSNYASARRAGRQLPVPPGYSAAIGTLSNTTIPFARSTVPSEMNSPRPANSHMNMITDIR